MLLPLPNGWGTELFPSGGRWMLISLVISGSDVLTQQNLGLRRCTLDPLDVAEVPLCQWGVNGIARGQASGGQG